jgi:hypothetical protein
MGSKFRESVRRAVSRNSSIAFKRRYDLAAIISRLAFIALRTAPLPYRFLKPAEVVA